MVARLLEEGGRAGAVYLPSLVGECGDDLSISNEFGGSRQDPYYAGAQEDECILAGNSWGAFMGGW